METIAPNSDVTANAMYGKSTFLASQNDKMYLVAQMDEALAVANPSAKPATRCDEG